LHSESQETTLELSNYPNPFNPSTTFAYNLPKAGRVEISLYNIKGQKVRNLLSADQDSGLHSVVWDGKDNNGSLCASGFYFCRIQSPAVA
jgi:flagellar hook assembly protein FlgD